MRYSLNQSEFILTQERLKQSLKFTKINKPNHLKPENGHITLFHPKLDQIGSLIVETELINYDWIVIFA